MRPIAVLLGLLAFAAVWTFAMPYAVAREALADGQPATIMAGRRDRLLFADGWSGLLVTKNVTARIATKPSATIRVPLPQPRPYHVVLRMDPVSPSGDLRQRVHVSLNGNHLDDLDLTFNRERIGEYRVSIPEIVTPGVHRLALRSDASFKFWYLRILPQ